GTGTINAHVDTSSGSLEMDLGHLDQADVTVTLDYDTAKAVFVDGTVSAAMKAFMEGKVRVQGEMAKLLSALGQLTPPDQSSVTTVQQRIREITA
ncbi:MAG TPA: SCP2 sterol-binding domain-containing protein, partial [Acidimicrobiales bacterium]|nr:SCP2 sterol-binding domain-containing protein [Acidimicrobiales bacterium]